MNLEVYSKLFSCTVKKEMYKRKFAFIVCFVVFGIFVFVSHLRTRKHEIEISSKQSNDQVHLAGFYDEARVEGIARTTTQPPTTPYFKYDWERYMGPMALLDDNTLRCKVLEMGCFAAIQPKNFVEVGIKFNLRQNRSDHLPSKEVCMDSCFTRKYRLAGYAEKEGDCYCSSAFARFISSKYFTAAKSADLSDDCRGTKYENIRLYSKLRGCGRGFSDTMLKLDRVGCMEVPSNLKGTMIALTQPSTSAQQCIMNCEMRSFTYAVPVTERNGCICSDSHSLFESAENMLKVMEACDKPGSTLVPVYRTYAHDPSCGPRRFLSMMQAPVTLLASYYGSGNTWIRHLIELATGVYTGSRYDDGNLYEGGMLGEYLPLNYGRVIVVKDHLFKLEVMREYQNAILFIRNPFDATLAEFARHQTHSHTGVINQDLYKSPAFKKFMRWKQEYWYKLAETTLKSFSRVLVVFFEDLKSNPVTQLRRIVEFLPEQAHIAKSGRDLERKLMCMNLDLVGKFKRPPRNLDYDPYNETARKEFNTKIQQLNNLLQSYNQPALPQSYFTSPNISMNANGRHVKTADSAM